jgi:hypothetical protein
MIAIHCGDVIEGILPRQREFIHIGVSGPNESRQPIENQIAKDLKSWRGPCHATSEIRVLPTPGTSDHAARRIVARHLPCLEASTHVLSIAALYPPRRAARLPVA